MDVIGGKQLKIVRIIHSQHGEAYGAGIARALKEDGDPTALPFVYNTLEKLQKRKLIEGRMGEPTAERGGKAKRLYSLTGVGRRVLEASIEADLKSKVGARGWRPIGGLIEGGTS